MKCRYHLARDARRGHKPSETCALDVADLGGVTLEIVGELFGFTYEYIRQIETKALRRFWKHLAASDLLALLERDERAP